MIIFMARKGDYKKSDSYAKKSSYAITSYCCSYNDYKRLTSDPKIKSKFVVWYMK